jgi:hypothetical protein
MRLPVAWRSVVTKHYRKGRSMTTSKREGEYTDNDPLDPADRPTEGEGEYTDSEIPGETAPEK